MSAPPFFSDISHLACSRQNPRQLLIVSKHSTTPGKYTLSRGRKMKNSPKRQPLRFREAGKHLKQGWVIRRRRIVRRIVFITYLTVFFKLLPIIRFRALNEFCSPKPPEPPRSTPRPSRTPQRHFQALLSPPEELPAPQNVA